MVADGDGAVVIPATLAGEVVDAAAEHEELEDWITGEMRRGFPLPGLYSPSEEAGARYRANKSKEDQARSDEP